MAVGWAFPVDGVHVLVGVGECRISEKDKKWIPVKHEEEEDTRITVVVKEEPFDSGRVSRTSLINKSYEFDTLVKWLDQQGGASDRPRPAGQDISSDGDFKAYITVTKKGAWGR
jgi:hypothetical protein